MNMAARRAAVSHIEFVSILVEILIQVAGRLYPLLHRVRATRAHTGQMRWPVPLGDC